MSPPNNRPIHLIKSPFLAMLLVFGLEGLTAALTYFTGGTKLVYPHFMYFPIVLAAYWGNLRGAVAAAAIGGLLLGPWMPMDVPGNLLCRQCPIVF